MQLRCRACDKDILADNINIQLGIAKCVGCNAVFNFVDKLRAEQVHERPPVGMPKRFRLDNWGPELVLTRRWYTHAVWFLLFFCIFWDGFLIVWYSAATAALFGGRAGAMAFVMFLFPIIHLLVGVGLTYLVIAMFLNKTVIRVTSGDLSVTHGPLPFGGNCRLSVADLKQVFCVEKRHRRKHGCGYTYTVEALKHDHSKLTLVSNLEELDQALFIEQQVEQHLKIRNERVPGEVRV